MSTVIADTEAAIWDRTIQPGNGNFSPDAARSILQLKLSPPDVERVNELSAKAQEGRLTPEEDRELENYLNVGRALELLKSKARLSLNIP